MKLVEVVRTAKTCQSTFDKLLNWAQSLGKTTVSCQVGFPFVNYYLFSLSFCVKETVNLLNKVFFCLVCYSFCTLEEFIITAICGVCLLTAAYHGSKIPPSFLNFRLSTPFSKHFFLMYAY